MASKPVLVSWSSGKDSAWALHVLRQQPERYDVRGIFTTVTPHFDRVAIQATPVPVLRVQAERLGLPLYEIPIPYPCSNEEYEAAMAAFLDMVRGLPPDLTAGTFAFGDLFLEDIRAYREAKLAGTGFEAIFPVWGMPTAELAQTMLRSGLKAIVTAVSPSSNSTAALPAVGSINRSSTICPQAPTRLAKTVNSTPASWPVPCSAVPLPQGPAQSSAGR